MAADLHLHTWHSDGSWSPSQLVDSAEQHGLTCIAVTDHDTVAGIAEAAAAAADRLEIIPGIEINTVYATASGGYIDVHILGYFIDTRSSALQRIIGRQQEARKELVENTIAACNLLGIGLTKDHVHECSGIGSIGRPHLAQAIVKAGGAASAAEAFERFMNRESPDYIPRFSVSPKEAIAAIEEAGGISSIAHPGKN